MASLSKRAASRRHAQKHKLEVDNHCPVCGKLISPRALACHQHAEGRGKGCYYEG